MKNLTQWKPLVGLNSFFDENFMSPFPLLHGDLAVDVYEEDDGITAEMSLPGVQESEIDISIEDDFLTVSGKREEKKETQERDYYSKEIKRGSFSRTVRLPRSVDATKASAQYADGVLKVTAPAVAGTKDRAVTVHISK